MSQRILLVVNPRAGSGNPPVAALVQALGAQGAEVAVQTTDQPWDTLIAALDRADILVVGGGDGTLNRFVGPLLERRVPLGIVPLGTANDLARTLGIPQGPEEAARLVTAGKTSRIDVGLANDAYFLNAAGIGLSVDIGSQMSHDEKVRLGVIAYAKHLWRLLRKGKGFHTWIEAESLRINGHVVQVTVANGRHYGGGMTVREDAAIDDGVLTVLLVWPRTMVTYLRHFMAFRSGRYRPGTPVALGRAPRLELRTRPPRRVSTDGEVRTGTPVHFRVLNRALEVFVP